MFRKFIFTVSFLGVFSISFGADLSLTVSLPKTEFVLGEPIFATAVLTNVSGKPALLAIKDFNYDAVDFVAIKEDGTCIRGYTHLPAKITSGKPTSPIPTLEVLSKESLYHELDMVNMNALKYPAGTYDLKAVFESDGIYYVKDARGELTEMKTWNGKIESPSISFRVVEPTGVDKEALEGAIKYSKEHGLPGRPVCFDLNGSYFLKNPTGSAYDMYARFYHFGPMVESYYDRTKAQMETFIRDYSISFLRANVEFHIGHLQRLCNRRDEARAQFQKVTEKFPTTYAAYRAQRALQEIALEIQQQKAEK